MNIVILIPSFKSDGPIKGAFAMAKLLSSNFNIFIISIRDTHKPNIDSDFKNIELRFLTSNSYFSKYIEYKNFLLELSKFDKTISFSMLFFPDLFNIFIHRRIAKTICSVRSNMFKNYYYDYGFLGIFFAFVHYSLFFFIDTVIVMDQSMYKIVKKFTFSKIFIVCNFIDEELLALYKKNNSSKRFNIIYLGSLTKRKSVKYLIYSFSEILKLKPNLILDIVGNGNELNKLVTLTENLNIKQNVIFHGHIDLPYELLSSSSIFVLPSKSEGTSRAALESLFFNIPIILKNVDGNKYLINSKNGKLFNDYKDLYKCILDVMNTDYSHSSLLPKVNSSNYVKHQLINIFNSN